MIYDERGMYLGQGGEVEYCSIFCWLGYTRVVCCCWWQDLKEYNYICVVAVL